MNKSQPWQYNTGMAAHNHVHHTAYPIIPRLAIPLSILIAFVGIYLLPVFDASHSVMSQFLLSLGVFLLRHVVATLTFLIFYTVSTFLLITHYTIPKRHKTVLHAVHEALRISVLSGGVGMVLGFLMIYLFGILNVYLVSQKVRLNPRSAAIVSGNTAIVGKMAANPAPPFISDTTYDTRDRQIISLLLENGKTGRFYKDSLIDSVQNVVTVPLSLPKNSLLLVGNTLLVAELDKEDLTEISPALGHVLVSSYFSPRLIKPNPQVTVLDRQEYLKLREDQINIRLAKIDKVITQVESAIKTDVANIAEDNEKILYNANGLEASIKERDSEYTACIQTGTADAATGSLKRIYTDSYCTDQKKTWETLITAWQKNIADWNDQLLYDKESLSQDQQYRTYLVNTRSLIASEKDQIPDELGIFEGDSGKIDIALDWVNSKSIASYVETLLHEYLHFASYISNERELPSFFEEGITEYFARTIMLQVEGQDTRVGYPLYVPVIQQLATKIPDAVLADIYFSKDEARLAREINAAFGEKFYERHETDFSLLPYLSNDKALKVVNVMLIELGGKEITGV